MGDTTYGDISGALYTEMLKHITTAKPAVKVAPKHDWIVEASDQRLIFELVSRGYAVAKMPAEQLAEQVTK